MLAPPGIIYVLCPIAVYRFVSGFLLTWLNIPFFSSLYKLVSQQNPKIYLRRGCGGGGGNLPSIIEQTFEGILFDDFLAHYGHIFLKQIMCFNRMLPRVDFKFGLLRRLHISNPK